MLFCLINSCQSPSVVEKDNQTELVDSLVITRDTVWEGDTIVSISVFKESDDIRTEEIFERYLYDGGLPSLKYTYRTEHGDSLERYKLYTIINFKVPSSKIVGLISSVDIDFLSSYPVITFKKRRNINYNNHNTLLSSINKTAFIRVLQELEKPTIVFMKDVDSILTMALNQNQFEENIIDSLNCRSRIEKVLDADLKVLEEKQKRECGDVDKREWDKSMVQLDTMKSAKAYFFAIQRNNNRPLQNKK